MNHLTDQLKAFLAAKASASPDPQRVVVTKEDIDQFFASLPPAKHRRI